jgi:site-specific DNA recombinase
MGSAWSNGRPAYRCRHGHTSASAPAPGRPRNAFIREDRVLPHLPALHLLLTGADGGEGQCRRRTRRGADARHCASPEDVIAGPHENNVTMTFDLAARTPHVAVPGCKIRCMCTRTHGITMGKVRRPIRAE